MRLHGDPEAPLCSSGKPAWRTAEAAEADRIRPGKFTPAEAAPASVNRDPAINVYHCKACGWFHMGTDNRRQRRSTLGNRRAGATGRRRKR